MEERLNQQVAVRGVPQIVDLSVSAKIRQQSQYVHWNRNSDLSHRAGFFTVLYVWLDEFRCHHCYRSPLYGAKAIPEHFNCQLIFAMKSIPSPRRPVCDGGLKEGFSMAPSCADSHPNIQSISFAAFQKAPKTS
ncbi:hypothetical protein [Dyella monticola]|uniref:hypothetical protein n=1 Tax=Dyella monticola TaxID=1927958 RepID=UPI0031B6C1A8